MGQVAGIALVWFIVEILIWYLVSQYTSGWYVFSWFVVAGFIGMIFIKKGMSVLNPMAKQAKQGGMPTMQPNEDSLMKTVASAVAGLLLFIPGLLSDVLALLVMLPPVQKKIKKVANNYVLNNQEKMMKMMADQMGGQNQNPFGNAGGQNPFGNMGGMNGQNPFGGMGGMNGSAQNPFNTGSPFKSSTTVEGTAKPVEKDVKKIKSANDD